MNWKNWFPKRPSQKFGERYRLSDSIVSVKIIAIVILTVFVPSILISALGIFAVYRAEPIVRDLLQHPLEEFLILLDQRLTTEWRVQRLRYTQQIESTTALHRLLRDLVHSDNRVRDAILYEDGEFRPIERESPFWLLDAPMDHAGLQSAWALEFQKSDFEAAREAYRRLTEGQPPEVMNEALLGHARSLFALGRWRDGVDSLRRIFDLYGLSEDGSGMPRGLPVLWRIVRAYVEHGDLGEAAQAARDLADFLTESSPWLEKGLRELYTERLTKYRNETNDLALEIALPGIGQPISTLIADPGNARRLRDRIPEIVEKGESGYVELPLPAGEVTPLGYFPTGNFRVVFLELSPDEFIGDVRLFTKEFRIPDTQLVVEPSSRSFEVAAEDPEDSPKLLSRPLPAPFESWRMRYSPTETQYPTSIPDFAEFKGWGIFWGLIVLCLTILLGVMVTVRSIMEEMQLSKMKTDFLSFVSHELKTPLTAIRMFAEMLMLERAGGEKDRRKCVEMIDKEAERLHRLIEQLLEFSRIQSHQQVFNFTTCDMSEVVEEAVEIFRDQNQDDGVNIVVNQAQHISKIRMDRSAMIELILNLVSNAHKYSKGRKNEIIINLKESIDDIFVEVTDFGMGIPKGEQRKIFEKFYRAQDYLTRDIEGTGLGLTFAKYIAKVHNGEIKVSSVVDQGSTFTLELRKNQVLAE